MWQSTDYVFAGAWCPLLFGFPTRLADYSLRGLNMEANQTWFSWFFSLHQQMPFWCNFKLNFGNLQLSFLVAVDVSWYDESPSVRLWERGRVASIDCPFWYPFFAVTVPMSGIIKAAGETIAAKEDSVWEKSTLQHGVQGALLGLADWVLWFTELFTEPWIMT